MSFGRNKAGSNSSDKKYARAWAKAGMSVDKIAAKLSLSPEMVKTILERNKAGNAPVATPVETVEQTVARLNDEGKDATDIAIELDMEVDVVETIIEGLDD